MRAIPLVLALCATLTIAAEEAAAPAADPKAQAKELETKLRAIREQTIKDDADLGKLKSEADDAKKRYETAVEAKLKDNADYQAIKAQIAELKGQKDGEKKKDAVKH